MIIGYLVHSEITTPSPTYPRWHWFFLDYFFLVLVTFTTMFWLEAQELANQLETAPCIPPPPKAFLSGDLTYLSIFRISSTPARHISIMN